MSTPPNKKDDEDFTIERDINGEPFPWTTANNSASNTLYYPFNVSGNEENTDIMINKDAWNMIVRMHDAYQKYIKSLEEKINKLENKKERGSK